MICFEWLQRPENVLAGSITWTDYQGPMHPTHVRIFHHKTGAEFYQPLGENGRLLYGTGRFPWVAVTGGSTGRGPLTEVVRRAGVHNLLRQPPCAGSTAACRSRRACDAGCVPAWRHDRAWRCGTRRAGGHGVFGAQGAPSGTSVRETNEASTAACGGQASNLHRGKSLTNKSGNGSGKSGNAASPNAQVPDIIGTASWDRTRDPQIHNLVL